MMQRYSTSLCCIKPTNMGSGGLLFSRQASSGSSKGPETPSRQSAVSQCWNIGACSTPLALVSSCWLFLSWCTLVNRYQIWRSLLVNEITLIGSSTQCTRRAEEVRKANKQHRRREEMQHSAFVATSSLMSVWCVCALNEPNRCL